jgi:hypothetical protein
VQTCPTFPNLPKLTQTCTNMHKHAQTCTNMHKHAQTCTNMHKHVQTCTNMHKHAHTCHNMHKLHKLAQYCTIFSFSPNNKCNFHMPLCQLRVSRSVQWEVIWWYILFIHSSCSALPPAATQNYLILCDEQMFAHCGGISTSAAHN